VSLATKNGESNLLAAAIQRLGNIQHLVRVRKRRRAAAVQDAGAFADDHRTARSVVECASPLALWAGVL
jgi:hypothetical protein